VRITRKLNKKFLIYFYTIYTISTSTIYVVYEFIIPLLQDKHAAMSGVVHTGDESSWV